MGGLANNGPCAGEFQQPVIRVSAPLIAHLEARLNRTDDGVARTDLGALPAELEKIDAWIADGTIGDPQHPNAADLQLASTIRLMLTFGDARPVPAACAHTFATEALASGISMFRLAFLMGSRSR